MNGNQFENNARIKANYEKAKLENDDSTPFERSPIVPLSDSGCRWYLAIIGLACLTVAAFLLVVLVIYMR